MNFHEKQAVFAACFFMGLPPGSLRKHQTAMAVFPVASLGMTL